MGRDRSVPSGMMLVATDEINSEGPSISHRTMSARCWLAGSPVRGTYRRSGTSWCRPLSQK